MDEKDKTRAIVAGPLLRDGNGDLWLIRRGLQFCNVRTDATRFMAFPEGDVPSTRELEGMAGTELRELLTRATMDGNAPLS